MQLLSFIWGISVTFIMMVAFFPCLGWINWINIPLAIAGLVISIVAMTSQNNLKSDAKTFAVIGLVGCSLAVFLGVIRLIAGAGIF